MGEERGGGRHEGRVFELHVFRSRWFRKLEVMEASVSYEIL